MLASRLVFPTAMAACLTAVWLLLRNDVHEGIAVFAVLVPGALTIALLERVMPYRQDWNQSDGDVKTDLIHLIIAQISIPRLMKFVWPGLLTGTTAYVGATFGSNLWPHHWNLVAQLFLILVIAEFGRYWFHRASHNISFLWRFHAVHHSPNRLYWMNAGRFHPFEKIYLLIPEVVPFVILGTSAEALALYFVFNGIHGLFQHSNIHMRLGWLNYIFSMTELHRWHHSKWIEDSNNNYGNNLILWDIIFGTFYWPKGEEVKSIGVFNPDYPKGYLGQLAAPFQAHIDKTSTDGICHHQEKPI